VTGWLPPGAAWLFCPADRPDRYAKAADAADLVILDLEDAVAAGAKAAAREALVDRPLDPARTVVRVNATGTADHDADLEALAATSYSTVMLPKCESAADVATLAPRHVVALIETPRGVLGAPECAAAAGVVAVMWGAEDLVAATGGTSSRHASGDYRDVARHARSTALLAAAAAGVVAVDAVYLDLTDLAGLRAEAEDAVAVGFGAKVAVHPRQVPVIREAFRPSPDLVAWARSVLTGGSDGVFAAGGRMVDAPVLRQAEAVLRRAERA
jgi:citrate lyase subunit beta/citryl-CoA lyase